jgi:hypothetical protein
VMTQFLFYFFRKHKTKLEWRRKNEKKIDRWKKILCEQYGIRSGNNKKTNCFFPQKIVINRR